MPNHMDMPAPGAPVRTCGPKVSHRNAPGAMSAMALLVSPVRPSVGRVVGGVDSGTDFSFRAWEESRDFESAPDVRAKSNCIGPNALSRIEVSQRFDSVRALSGSLLPASDDLPQPIQFGTLRWFESSRSKGVPRSK